MYHQESLFELVRKEDVIIWAGAGMSLYAGHPSVQQFAEILIERLTSQEKSRINLQLPLTDLAEEFYRLKAGNRNALIQILKETFLKEPVSIDTHNSLSIIPHFKTIITTNYDTLFERAYKANAQIAYLTKHIPYLEKNKTHIFKVHGDLNDPDSIIITRSDYIKFFKENSDNGTYWSVIRERLATKSVLFLGYNLEDPNVSIIFDRIADSLGENRKECFLVAPNLPQHKIDDLTRKRIHYINSTAEDIISNLLLHLKKNVIADIEEGKISADTFRQFLANIDLLPDLKADKNSYKVSSIKGTREDIHGTMNLTFKNESEFIQQLKDYVTGKKFGTFEIPEDKLLNAEFWYGGVQFPNSEGITKIEFKSHPRLNSNIDIKFDDGFEVSNIPVKLYGSISLIEIHLEFDNAKLIINTNIEAVLTPYKTGQESENRFVTVKLGEYVKSKTIIHTRRAIKPSPGSRTGRLHGNVSQV